MANNVCAKLLYVNGCQKQVWEIRDRKGAVIFGERFDLDGYRPIGAVGPIEFAGSQLYVVPAVNKANVPKDVKIWTEEEGFEARRDWYQKIVLEKTE